MFKIELCHMNNEVGLPDFWGDHRGPGQTCTLAVMLLQPALGGPQG